MVNGSHKLAELARRRRSSRQKKRSQESTSFGDGGPMVELRQCVETAGSWQAVDNIRSGSELSPCWTDTPPDDEWRSRLLRIIQGEIIPRLMLTHQVVAQGTATGAIMPGAHEVAELAQLILDRDVAAASLYVQGLRA